MKSSASSPSPIPAAGHWLVLGASGFIGSTVLTQIKAEGYSAVGSGHTATARADPWQSVDVFDAASLRACLRNWQPTVIINAIGPGAVMTGPALRDFFVRSTTLILEAIQAEVPSCRVVLLGSAAEYGNSSDAGGLLETGPCRPLSDYGRAKLEQFQVATKFAAQGLSVITARLFNPIGLGQGRHQLVGNLLDRIRRGENPVRVHSGNHVRDWIDVRDAARGLITLATAIDPPAVANLCTGEGQPVAFIARAVGELTGATVETIPGEILPEVLWHSVGNPGRMHHLGWRPRHGLMESLTDQFKSTL